MPGPIRAEPGAAARDLLTAGAVRARAGIMLDEGVAGRLPHFDVRPDRLGAVAAYVAGTIRRNYPTLEVPPHARWRHFMVDGVDRWARLSARLGVDRPERARIRFDLAVTSVLLDAGAGPEWRWHDAPTGRMLARSEGLALASLAAFEAGVFSSHPALPLQADAAGLQQLTADRLSRAFQVAAGNPLEGLDGRVALLQRLGEAAGADRASFGAGGRIGCLYDRLTRETSAGAGSAPVILTTLLEGLRPVRPNPTPPVGNPPAHPRDH